MSNSAIHIFFAAVRKDVRILLKDKVGMLLLFLMPVVLVLVITSVQNSTFEMVNDNRVGLLVMQNDTGRLADQLVKDVENTGLFKLERAHAETNMGTIRDSLEKHNALAFLHIPVGYSAKTHTSSERAAQLALRKLGMGEDSVIDVANGPDGLELLYLPVLQKSYVQTIHAAIAGAVEANEKREFIRSMLSRLDSTVSPDSLLVGTSKGIKVVDAPLLKNGNSGIPNATQHNVPAWTLFAMFFIVITMGSEIVRERNSGSFVRMKTMPSGFLVPLLAKQFTFLLVTVIQTALIFSLGVWLFPKMGLPALTLPANILPLFIVTLLCGWCAVSYATCVGLFARTQEQTNGFGAVSVVIMAALGGIMVPAFAMPSGMKPILNFSPLHWCLEAYYGLFLEGGGMAELAGYAAPILVIILILQGLILWGLKRTRLI
jgi:ABC-2 type transport system permease protein